jgi:hypothetical protein
LATSDFFFPQNMATSVHFFQNNPLCPLAGGFFATVVQNFAQKNSILLSLFNGLFLSFFVC